MSEHNIIINGVRYFVCGDMSILEFCRQNDILIPTLCYHPDLTPKGDCRMCVVEIEGERTLQAACCTPLRDGMVIRTDSNIVRSSRRTTLELLIANHYTDCLSCDRNLNCELQTLAEQYGIKELRWEEKRERTVKRDASSPSLVRDNNKCILCYRCVSACQELQGVGAVCNLFKGDSTIVGSAFNRPLAEVPCINCGQCVLHCPTGALTEKSSIFDVWKAIEDKSKIVVVQTAPSIRAALGEEFGYPPGTRVTGKMISALKAIGFDYVFDTQFAADLTIIEEGFELLGRLRSALLPGSGGNATLPMMTSCSPGWINYQEIFFPELLDNLSSCKSPQQMFGAVLKTYWAQKMGVDPSKIVSVSVMPCIAKKFEAMRPEMNGSGYQDVDLVLTTREIAKMIKQQSVDFRQLDDSQFDDPLGNSTGAAVIFGATGGVTEAALRSVYELVTGREAPFENLNIMPVRGLDGVKEAAIRIEQPLDEWKFLDGVNLKIAIVWGTANAGRLMERVRNGTADYHFIEIMACPGGCLGGGGQPVPTNMDIRKGRMKAIYAEDMDMTYRKSHENPAVKALYADFLGKPNGHRAHELLHTNYLHRGRY